MRRTDRLYALVEELRARAPRAVGRAELAARLEVTPRTVERDILALQQAGVPIWSQRGRGGGYAIDPQWSLPPLNFDATEALAVIAALATARSLPFADAGRRAERKLLAAMTEVEAAKARELAARIRLGTFGERATQRVMAAVEQAVVDRRVVEITYRDRTGAASTRLVEAHGLHLASTGSYLVAWCRLREAGRAFRLDRIESVRPTDETAPPREVDALLDWVDEAIAPGLDLGRGPMPTRRPRTSWGPPRKADHRTGAGAPFARAVATGLPGAEARTRGNVARVAVDGHVFVEIDEVEESVLAVVGPGEERSLLLPRVGRDAVRATIEEAWCAAAPRRLVTAHTRARQRWLRQPAITHDDIRQVILSLPGANEGPIWGQALGFRVGDDKRTRFARFGPPIGSGVGNLLAPDDEDTLVILHCPRKPALLAAAPDRFFTTAHYGPPDEPGGVIVRLAEHRGAAALDELAELLEEAWREVAPADLVEALDGERAGRSTVRGGRGVRA